MSSPALAGVAATHDVVIVADRDPADRTDVFRCFNADGTDRWTLRYAAPGALDYGNSARATPLIHHDIVILAGAHGFVHAVGLTDGKIRWKKHLQRDFGGPDNLSWGFCSSPLLVDDRLILNPGAPNASVIALKVETGEVIWKAPGNPPSNGSFVLFEAGGKKQIVGYDMETLGGWDVVTGQRLWTLKPRRSGDFNVPTPIVWNEKLIVATENNGTRVYGFDTEGSIKPVPLEVNEDLAPDCHSPVVGHDRLFGVSSGLFCLDLNRGLQQIWKSDADEFQEYTSLIVSPSKILITSLKGKLLLVSAKQDRFELVSELQLFKDESELYSHPALVGTLLYARGSKSLVCLELKP